MINSTKIKFVLPTTIDAVKDHELNIYKNNLVRMVNDIYTDNIEIKTTYANAGSKTWKNFVQINPIASGVMSYTFKLFNNYGTVIQSESISLNVVDSVGLSAAKNILMVGDSINTNTYKIAQTVSALFSALGGTQPSFVGTKNSGLGTLNEGISGWTWEAFALSSSSPFWSGTEIDFEWYSTTNLAGATIDLISFQLGVNDSLTNHGVLTDSEIDAIIVNAKILIDKYLVYNSSGKCVIILSTLPCISGDAFSSNYDSNYEQNDHLTNMINLNARYVEEFADGAYDANVCVNIGGLCHDRSDGVATSTAIDKNSRITVQKERYNNGVHPTGDSYGRLIADGIFPTFLKLLQ